MSAGFNGRSPLARCHIALHADVQVSLAQCLHSGGSRRFNLVKFSEFSFRPP